MKTDDHGRIGDTVPISERPAIIDDRAIPGHWEGDLLFGSANRDKEMADHTRFTVATDIKVYFCDPQSPWHGSNENTNGLLRQYFPKRIDLSTYSQAKLNAVAKWLNERPRKTLDFDTPAERAHQFVASTG